jgi:hypothetical protein
MRLKIRCDGESTVLLQNFLDLNWAWVGVWKRWQEHLYFRVPSAWHVFLNIGLFLCLGPNGVCLSLIRPVYAWWTNDLVCLHWFICWKMQCFEVPSTLISSNHSSVYTSLKMQSPRVVSWTGGCVYVSPSWEWTLKQCTSKSFALSEQAPYRFLQLTTSSVPNYGHFEFSRHIYFIIMYLNIMYV